MECYEILYRHSWLHLLTFEIGWGHCNKLNPQPVISPIPPPMLHCVSQGRPRPSGGLPVGLDWWLNSILCFIWSGCVSLVFTVTTTRHMTIKSGLKVLQHNNHLMDPDCHFNQLYLDLNLTSSCTFIGLRFSVDRVQHMISCLLLIDAINTSYIRARMKWHS